MCVLSVSLAVMQQSAAEKERGRSGQFGKRKLHHFPSFSWTGGNRSYPLRRVASPLVPSEFGGNSFYSYGNLCQSSDNISFSVIRKRLHSLALSHHAYRQTTLRFRFRSQPPLFRSSTSYCLHNILASLISFILDKIVQFSS